MMMFVKTTLTDFLIFFFATSPSSPFRMCVDIAATSRPPSPFAHPPTQHTRAENLTREPYNSQLNVVPLTISRIVLQLCHVERER